MLSVTGISITHESMEIWRRKFRGYNGNHGSAAESGHGRWGLEQRTTPSNAFQSQFVRVGNGSTYSKHRHSKSIPHMISNHTALLSDSLVYGP
jgi:hypothetical protein